MASPRMPRALSAATSDLGAGRYPRPLLMSVVSWLLLAVLLMISRVGAVASSDAQETNAATGVQAVRAPDGDQHWFSALLPWLGVAVLVAAVLLFLGFAWTRILLALLGMLAVVGLAQAALWLAIPAAVLFVLGCVGSVMISSHRYVTRPRVPSTSAARTDPETGRMVS